jgi:hypothetical protein
MARKPKFPEIYQPTVIQTTLNDWVEKATPKSERTKPGVPKKVWERALQRVSNSFETGDWSASMPLDLVATYALCHRFVYKVDASELTPSELHKAKLIANRFFVKEFERDLSQFVEYARWVFKREKMRETKRVGDELNGQRIGWRLFFSGSLLTDWRAAKMRNGK